MVLLFLLVRMGIENTLIFPLFFLLCLCRFHSTGIVCSDLFKLLKKLQHSLFDDKNLTPNNYSFSEKTPTQIAERFICDRLDLNN